MGHTLRQTNLCRPHFWVLVCLCVGFLAGARAADDTALQLRVMNFNVEYGGTVVDFNKVIEAIQIANPDIVGLEEPAGNTQEIARRLGWPHFNRRTDVISRFPIIDPPGGDGRYVFVEVRPGEVVAVANVHLSSDPYGPYLTQRGQPLAKVLELEQALRLPEIAPYLQVLPPLARSGIPVFLLGDFNSPSHLDWTPQTVGLRSHMPYPVIWPVSSAISAAGFTDSFRAAHPDPVATPGLTWWAPRPSTEDVYGAGDPADRIDLIFAAGPVTTLDSIIIGEAGHPDVTLSVTPWPSDHRAVLSTFSVTPAPAPAPVMVAVNDQRLIVAGDMLRVYYRRTGVPGEAIEIIDSELRASAGVAFIPTDPHTGSVPLATDGLIPGSYAVALKSGDGKVLSRAEFRVKESQAVTEVSLDKKVYRPGEAIVMRWRNAPGNRWDWIAIYATPAGAIAAPLRNKQKIWRYTGSEIEGEFVVDAHLQDEGAWPLAPGHYTLFYMQHDEYDPLASANFEVRK